MPVRCPQPTDIPPGIGGRLMRDLALLSRAPAGIAESTIALMRVDQRPLLEARALIDISAGQPVRIEITQRGWQVIDACAQIVEYADANGWDARPVRRYAIAG